MNTVVRGSSDNIFEDLGTVRPRMKFVQAQVMSQIAKIINAQDLTQKEAAEILGIPQSKVSCLINGKLSMFSLDHLFELLNALDRDVKIVIKPKSKNDDIATTKVA